MRGWARFLRPLAPLELVGSQSSLKPLTSLEVKGWPRYLELLASLEVLGWSRFLKPLASLEVVGWLRYCYLIRKNWNTTLFCNFWPQMTLTQVWCQELQFDIWFSLFASSLRFDPKLPQICSLTFRKFPVLPFSPFRKILGAHYLIDAFYLITIPVF